MYIPKRYGESKIDTCPFCSQHARSMNAQGVPVCSTHRKEEFGEMKCVCGEYLEMRSGKFGVFFNCLNCGNLNLRKTLELNPQRIPVARSSQGKGLPVVKESQRQETIRSDDPRYFE